MLTHMLSRLGVLLFVFCTCYLVLDSYILSGIDRASLANLSQRPIRQGEVKRPIRQGEVKRPVRQGEVRATSSRSAYASAHDKHLLQLQALRCRADIGSAHRS